MTHANHNLLHLNHNLHHPNHNPHHSKGHGFSRAMNTPNRSAAFAPEVRLPIGEETQ